MGTTALRNLEYCEGGEGNMYMYMCMYVWIWLDIMIDMWWYVCMCNQQYGQMSDIEMSESHILE